MSRVDYVAEVLCREAGKSVNKTVCLHCFNGHCTMVPQFREEARAAIRAVNAYDGKTFSEN